MAAVTLTEVGRRAGVSLATATSHQRLSPHPGGGDRQESPAAAEEPGYVANAQTQALARSATGLIGLVVHDIADPYFFTITRGAQLVAREHGSQVLLAGAEREEQAELDAVAAFVAYRTKAIILAGSRRQPTDHLLARELGRYITNGGRVVTLGKSTIPGAEFLEVGNWQGARQLAAALIGRGITRFAILSGAGNSWAHAPGTPKAATSKSARARRPIIATQSAYWP